MVGQEEAVRAALTALVARGHILLEGPPGTGKTFLACSLAKALDLSFQRIACTADLMPADVIGTYIIMETPQGRRTFEFHKGPLFAQVVLVDHINRAPPKTQSALLQAMEEESITVGTESFALPRPFLLIATQNPWESEGTFPLPEAELDRFLLKVNLKPPSAQQLDAILERLERPNRRPEPGRLSVGRIVQMGEAVGQVPVPLPVRRWVAALVAATWPHDPMAPECVRRFVETGSGPRGAKALVLAAKVRAIEEGRSEVSADDVRIAVPSALAHRLRLNPEGLAQDVSPYAILEQLVQSLTPP